MKIAFLLTLLLINLSATASNPIIAVATNFNHAMSSIISSFEREYNITIDVSYGSTGSLYSQILNGAPYDAFFSADSKTIDLLTEKDLVVKDSSFIYANGELSFICRKCDLSLGWKNVLTNQDGSISIANPKLAPYGLSALKALESLDEFSKIKDRIVYGTNISQAYQYVESGNIPFGLISKSLVIAGKVDTSRYQDIGEDLYPQIKQSAVILKRTKSLKTVNKFMEFMKSKKTLLLIKSHGYKEVGP
mgnify:CR=1 FL=1